MVNLREWVRVVAMPTATPDLCPREGRTETCAPREQDGC